jgi:hypothetical protein
MGEYLLQISPDIARKYEEYQPSESKIWPWFFLAS